jgi:DMSO/TMAO reductase YedYZ heme-binding membrane subunit
MLFLFSLIFTFVVALLLHKAVHKFPVLFYLLSIITAVAMVAFDLLTNIPIWDYVVESFGRGAMATAIFVIVMYLGALPRKFPCVVQLHQIRGELSIIACILTIVHIVHSGRYYFPRILFNISELNYPQIIATFATFILLIIMLPLFITSFRSVRNKIKPKSWKNLQKWAYPFYGLLYVHIMVIMGYRYYYFSNSGLDPDTGEAINAMITLIIYTAVFLIYFILRLRKYFIDRNKEG